MKPTYETRLAETQALRAECAPIFLPLFDHCLVLAADSRKRQLETGYAYLGHRWGRELAHARKVAGYPVCAVCGQPIINGTDTCSSDSSHAARPVHVR